jgi:pyruvate kinase
MTFPGNKTKIVCTIGPASGAPETLERMIRLEVSSREGAVAIHGSWVQTRPAGTTALT